MLQLQHLQVTCAVELGLMLVEVSCCGFWDSGGSITAAAVHFPGQRHLSPGGSRWAPCST